MFANHQITDLTFNRFHLLSKPFAFNATFNRGLGCSEHCDLLLEEDFCGMFAQFARNERLGEIFLQKPKGPFGIAVTIHTFRVAYAVAGKELLVAVVARDVVARVALDRFAALFGEDFAAYGAFTFGCG